MKTVVIKKYANEASAYIDAEYLRSEGIECQVMNSGSVMTMLTDIYHLVVMDEDKEKAEELLGM